MIAVSTAWNAGRHVGWAPAAHELLSLGFDRIALDGPALQADAADAGRLVREARGRVAALYATAPSRESGSPVDGGGLVDVRPERREPAVAAALAAGRAALAAGTATVILRAGSIPSLDGTREDRWTERLGREGATAQLVAEIAAARAELTRDRTRFLEMLCRSVWHLARALPDVVWAVETPSSVAGLPFPDEIEPFLGELRGRKAGYWHDAAHAARFGALGAADPSEWIHRAAGATRGVTLSDWSAPSLGAPADSGAARLPVGAGIVDWSALRTQTSLGMARVVRLSPEFPGALLAESVRAAEARGF